MGYYRILAVSFICQIVTVFHIVGRGYIAQNVEFVNLRQIERQMNILNSETQAAREKRLAIAGIREAVEVGRDSLGLEMVSPR